MTTQTPLELLIEMLEFKRPYGGETVIEFTERYIAPLENLPTVEYFYVDNIGNTYVKTHGDSSTLFTAHTDTMHHNDGKQEVWVDAEGTAFITDAKEVLGADDGAGVWLLIEMIKAGVPGTYQFTVGEERGGVGSSHAAQEHVEYLSEFTHAIAFDRKATTSVITHQFAGRCCSDAFGLQLAELLGMGHILDTTGSFTDTANYTSLIPECTNISIGYYNEHSSKEELDTNYALALREKMLSIDWANTKLLVERKVTDIDEDFMPRFKRFKRSSAKLGINQVLDIDDLQNASIAEILAWVKVTNHGSAAYTMVSLLDHIEYLNGELEMDEYYGYQKFN